MKTSDQINELAAALALAQGEIENAATDSSNPHFNSSYASLASVRSAVTQSLSKHGLCVIQIPVTQDGRTVLVTRMVHKSGQWIEGECELKLDKPTMQGLGSALSYMRRYALSAITGVAEADDDGNEAEKHPAKKAAKSSTVVAVKPKEAAVNTVTPIKKVSPPITDEQRVALWNRLKVEKKWNDEEAKRYVFAMTNKQSSKELVDDDYIAIMMDLDDQLLGSLK